MKRTKPKSKAKPEASPLEKVIAQMASHHGVATDRQVRQFGVSLKCQSRLIRIGMWRRHGPGVIVDAAMPVTWHQRAMAATCAPGARASLAAAAAARLHRIDSFADIERLLVLIPHGGRVRVTNNVTVIESRRLISDDVVVVDSIPATSTAVTLIYLAKHRLRVEQAMDSVLRDGASVADLRSVFERWQGYGVSGPRRVLELLHDRVDARLPRSWFQRLASGVFASAGITLVDEWPVVDQQGKLLAELDLADPDVKVGVECQSWEHHGSPAAQRRDESRKRKLRQLGWDIVEVWWSDLDRIDEVLADLVLRLERARALKAARG